MARVSVTDLTHAVRGVDFPAERKDLQRQARQNDAGNAELEALEEIPNQTYESITDVTAAYGKGEGGEDD
ncbi:MAG: DUF2795 domain-containing protein [Oceanicaulis sp.]